MIFQRNITPYLVNDEWIAHCSLEEVLEGDVLDNSTPDIWTSPSLNSGAVLCVGHFYISRG
jgi:hypothetical protein